MTVASSASTNLCQFPKACGGQDRRSPVRTIDDRSDETLASIRILLEMRDRVREDIRAGNAKAWYRYYAVRRLLEEYEPAWFLQVLDRAEG